MNQPLSQNVYWQALRFCRSIEKSLAAFAMLAGVMILLAMPGLSLGNAFAQGPAASQAVAFEKVSFPVEKGENLNGYLFRPAKDLPFKGIIALHGCGGIEDRFGQPDTRTRQWADLLTAHGYSVLFPDSFGSRHLGSQCRVRMRSVRAHAERVEDAFAALRYLAKISGEANPSIALIGWSNGASTVLAALAAQSRPVLDFSRAVAFYPGCRSFVSAGGWHSKIPLLVLIGAVDDWTPARPCKELADEAKKQGSPAEIVIYPHAFHDFDHPTMAVHRRWGLAIAANRMGFAHSGTNPAAREDALRRVPEFLAKMN